MSSPSVRFIPTGAALQELILPSGRNLVLNFHTRGEYADNPSHLGATIGRVANRLKNAKLDCVDGKAWTLDANNSPNSLHGGHSGWGKKDWRGPTPVNVNGKECVEFKYLSAHLDEGFPGEVEVRVLYSAEHRDQKFVVNMDYEAKLLGGAEETAVNITNHR
jgi:aldose 1-epimerase